MAAFTPEIQPASPTPVTDLTDDTSAESSGGRRGFLGLGAKPEAPLETPGFSLADEIDSMLQQKLIAAGINTPVRITSGLDGLLQIDVQGRRFSAVDEVEPAQIKGIIQQAIQDWERR